MQLCHDAAMRTTVDLPEDLHRVVLAMAHAQGTSLSDVVSLLLRRAIGTPGTAQVAASERTGLEVINLGRTITSTDVRAVDDE